MGIKITNKDINKEIENIKKMFPSEKEFEDALKKQNMDEDDLRNNIEKNLLLEKVKEKVVGDIKITDKDVKEYYDKNKDQFKVGNQVKVAHILVKDEKTAKTVKEDLDKGGDFVELAKKHSTDTANKDKGGDLGWITKEQVVPEFGNKAFSMKIGEISDPVKTEFGFHIIRVDDTKQASTKSLEEVKDVIKAQLTEEKKSKKFNDWL